MARVKGPLFSLDASGSLKKTIVYSKWKGRQYVRQHAIPLNPQSPAQVNVRLAWTLLVLDWQAAAPAVHDTWDEFGKQFQMSGFNQYISRGMDAYVDQLGTATPPISVAVVGDPPLDVWTWT